MKLWLLRPISNDALWEPWYDKAFGFVVRAENERDARSLAAGQSGDEGKIAWTAAHSTRVELTTEGPEEVVMIDEMSA